MAIVRHKRFQAAPLLEKPTVTHKKRGRQHLEAQEEECEDRDNNKLRIRAAGGRLGEEESANTVEIAGEDEKPKKRRVNAKKVAEEAERYRERRVRNRAQVVEGVEEKAEIPRRRRGRPKAEAVQVTIVTKISTVRSEGLEVQEKEERSGRRIVKADKSLEDADEHRAIARLAKRLKKHHQKPKKREQVKVGEKSRADSVELMEEEGERPRGRIGASKVMAERLRKSKAVLKTRGADEEVRRFRRRREAVEVAEEYPSLKRGAESLEVQGEYQKPCTRSETSKIQENKEKGTTGTGKAEIPEREGSLKDEKVEVKQAGKKTIRIRITDPYVTESSTDEEELAETGLERNSNSYLYEVEMTLDGNSYPSLQKLQNPSPQQPPAHSIEQTNEVSSKKEEDESRNTNGWETSESEGIEDCFLRIPGPRPSFDIPLKDVYHHLLLN